MNDKKAAIFAGTVRLVLVSLLVVGLAWAVTSTSRKLPTAYDENTICASGCDYADIATWWTTECNNVDMVTATMGEVGSLQAGIHTGGVALNIGTGATDVDYFPLLRAAEGLGPDDVTVSYSGAENYLFDLACNNIGIYDLSLTAYSTDSSIYGLRINGFDGVKIIGCDIYNISAIDTANHAIMIFGGADGTIICNNIIRGTNSSGTATTSVNIYSFSGVNTYIYNNTIYQAVAGITATYGIYVQAGNTALAKNNIIVQTIGSTTIGAGITKTTNLEATDLVTVNFVNAAGGDFHLTADNASVIGQGTALVDVPDDFDNVLRGDPPDIGAYEYVSRGNPIFFIIQ